MNILITNDDGVQAEQLLPLIRWCQKLGAVTTVVPLRQQSGMSHSIELHSDFEAKQVPLAPDVTVWTVDSSPADCVRFAILGQHMPIDLVISGINNGYNIGTDIVYSGTVGAASEAVALGVPAIALSTCPEYYDSAVEQLDVVFSYVNQNKLLDRHNCYNINIPPAPKGIRITHQGGPYYSDDFACVGNDRYVPVGKCVYADRGDLNLDTDAVMHGYISVLPLTIDRTDHAIYRALTEAVPERSCVL